MSSEFESWGRYPKSKAKLHRPRWLSDEIFPQLTAGQTVLPCGQGRSYGDVCLNDAGYLLSNVDLRRLISFDQSTGILCCESGVTLNEIIDFALPRGWFLPVTPGTKFVSVGGAVANDVHGKNHHVSGTFGAHVECFELARSDGSKRLCSRNENTDLFRATIGGLGLTGFITWVTIKLKPVVGSWIDYEGVKFASLDAFFEVSKDSAKNFEYTVAWIDCVAAAEGRGIFMRGNHSQNKDTKLSHASHLVVPFELPGFVLNKFSMQAFNWLYYHKQFQSNVKHEMHYDPFFYPLDSVLHWNRIYGARGFLQFQCVVPSDANNRAIREIFEVVLKSRRASFLAIVKEFGDSKAEGLLSFPRPGITLCMDFAFAGSRTLELMRELESKVSQYGGAIYPAKDACMSAASYKQYFPAWKEFTNYIDPKISSSFWRRVMQS